MSTPSTRLVTLVGLPNEMEAAIVVDALARCGIRASAVGAASAGFRAEAPGLVSVLVAEDDAARALEVLSAVDLGSEEVDWSQVDVGQPEDAEDEADSPSPGERPDAGEKPVRRPQFRLATLFFLQAAICAVLAIWKTSPVLMVAAAVGALVAMTIAGTVLIARHGDRLRR